MTTALPYKEKTLFVAASLFFLLIFIASLWFQQVMFVAIPFAIMAALFFLKDVRIPFYLLMCSIPMSINLQEMTGISLDFPDEPIMLSLSVFFVFFALQNFRNIGFGRWLQHPLIQILLLSFLWMSVTVVFSTNVALSSKYLLKRIWFIVPFLCFPIIFFQDKIHIKRAFTLMFVPLLLIIFIVLYRFSALGFRFEDVHDPIQPFFQNHVMYGSMLSCFIPLIAGAIFLHKRFGFSWVILIGAMFVFLAGVYFSYSRAAWMAVLFALVTMACIRFKVMHYARLLFYAVVLSAVLWLSNNNQYLSYRPKFEKTIMHASLSDHIMATIQGTDISSAERYYRWIAAVRMSVDHPLTGVGPNNFYDNYKHYTIAAYKTWVSRNMERSTTHNYFLFMLVEQGYPAMILYALLIFMIFYYGQKVYHRQTERFDKVVVMAAICMIAALFVNNFFSELLETDKIGSLFLMGIALIIAIDLKNSKRTNVESLV